jgi:hypothetical protein
MKATVLLVSLALLALASAASADAGNQPAAGFTVTPASPATSVDLSLQKLFSARKPVNRTTSCYDNVFEYCMSSCYELSQTNGCDFFANQECLCERSWADCPVCY